MNQDVKKLWIDALRSGEYRQGHGFLTTVDPDGQTHYCCLGVLCELATRAGITASKTSEVTGQRKYDDSVFYLPDSVQTWAGLNDSNPALIPGQADSHLGVLNDEKRLSFAEIATLIEASNL